MIANLIKNNNFFIKSAAKIVKNLHICKKNRNFARILCKFMASWQEIRALEEKIYDVVDEYLNYPDGYQRPSLRVYLNKDEMTYNAELDDNLEGTEDDGIYPILDIIRDGDDGKEPDVDKISDIANSWIFLD